MVAEVRESSFFGTIGAVSDDDIGDEISASFIIANFSDSASVELSFDIAPKMNVYRSKKHKTKWLLIYAKKKSIV